MSDRPLLFISAVSAEHRSLRGTIASMLDHEGYDTDFQEVLGTEHGDISEMLARHVDACNGVIQLVGQRYGYAPPAPHPEFGECSYTQFETLYARSIGKPVRYLLLDPAHPTDNPAQPDPVPANGNDPAQLQAAYRLRVEKDTALWHPSTSIAETKNRIYELRPVLVELRREWRERMERQEYRLRRLQLFAGVTLLALICGGIYFGKMKQTTNENNILLKQLLAAQSDKAKEGRATGMTLADHSTEELLAYYAQRTKRDPATVLAVIEAALSSDDLSVRSDGLMLKQQFPEAAALSRQAGDAKAARRKAMQVRDATLAVEAALDYRREGLAHYYQLHYPPAITAYEIALAQITRASQPELWAMLHNDLACALRDHGSRTDPATGNQLLARAVTAYHTAQEVFTCKALPQQWAMTQNNLAIALREQGSRSEGLAGLDLLEQAVTACRAALSVYTLEASPQNWAWTQDNLASALGEQVSRSEGQAGLDLLEQAVTANRDALEVCTREALWQQWSSTQNNLAGTLWLQGRRSEGQAGLDLLGQAEIACRAALVVVTREALPQQWAAAQCNLGNTLSEQGSRSEGQIGQALLGQAVTAYRAALEVLTREALPQQWANTKLNLGTALLRQGDQALAAGERQRLYREAEEAYLAALEVWTKAAMPYRHDVTQKNLRILRAKMAEK